jgi:hypothetical protein
LGPILRRVRQRPFVLEDLSKIAAIDPPAAVRATDEVLSLALGRIAEKLPNISAARNAGHRSSRQVEPDGPAVQPRRRTAFLQRLAGKNLKL